MALGFIIHRMLYQRKDAYGMGGNVRSCMTATAKERPNVKAMLGFCGFSLTCV